MCICIWIEQPPGLFALDLMGRQEKGNSFSCSAHGHFSICTNSPPPTLSHNNTLRIIAFPVAFPSFRSFTHKFYLQYENGQNIKSMNPQTILVQSNILITVKKIIYNNLISKLLFYLLRKQYKKKRRRGKTIFPRDVH